MRDLLLWSYSITALLVSTVNSIEIPMRLSLSEVCNLKDELSKYCKDIRQIDYIENQVCSRKELLYSDYFLDCEYNHREERNMILILNSRGLKYFCSLNLVRELISSPKNMKSYEIKYFNCDLLYKIAQTNYTDEHHNNSLDNHQRKLQSSCRIGLNLYSVIFIQTPLPSYNYLMNVMNQCSLDYSWLCKNSTISTVMLSNHFDLFKQVNSNPYLSTEYDIVESKESYSIDVLSLRQGGLRKECWGNNRFERVPITSEVSGIYSTNNNRLTMSRYNSYTPSCRMIGYYKAKYTGLANIKFYVNGTANAWIFDNNILPNFPNIAGPKVYETSMNLVKDQFYFVRFDIVYLSPSSGLYNFNVTYPNISSFKVYNTELFYPIRTDYSPLNLSSLNCNTSYYLPASETNGDLICPQDNLNCNQLSFTKRLAIDGRNPLCELYRWENGIQICEKCNEFSMIYDNECICSENYHLDKDSARCIEPGSQIASISLHKVSSI
jgi:hypothetical protein